MLNEDVLRLIIEKLDINEDLVSLMRASRQMYRLAATKLYRTIDLNVSLGSHRRLLRLLGKTAGPKPSLIRSIEIEGLHKASVKTVIDLLLALLKLTNLGGFECESRVILPACLMSTLRLPETQNVILGNIRLEPGVPQPLHSILTRRSGPCLTSFDFTFVEETHL
jgi:hypothetical protein